MSLADVAKAAGVSTATVSRVLNQLPCVHPSTARRVKEALEMTRYVPPARNTASGDTPPSPPRRRRRRSHTLVLMTIGGFRQALQAPPVTALIAGITRHVGPTYALAFMDFVDPKDAGTQLQRHRADGIIVVGLTESVKPDLVGAVSQVSRHWPLVWAMEPPGATPGMDRVAPDHQRIGQMAMEYLASRRCRQFMFLGSHAACACSRLRYQSFMNAASGAGSPVSAYLVGSDPAVIDSYGKRVTAAPALEPLVAAVTRNPSRPLGLFVSDVETTAALYPLLAARGLRPGRDVILVSCGGDEAYLAGLKPRPAAIDIGCEQIGAQAVARLLARLEQPELPPLVMHVAPRLVVAETPPAEASPAA